MFTTDLLLVIALLQCTVETMVQEGTEVGRSSCIGIDELRSPLICVKYSTFQNNVTNCCVRRDQLLSENLVLVVLEPITHRKKPIEQIVFQVL